MTIAEMLEQSGVLTLLGMAVVFGFLALVIISVTVVGKIIHAIGADKDLDAPAAGAGSSPSSPVKATAVAAAITAAVTEYQNLNS
jgi:oxaloacetate decarboxylase gamma subunit